ncbi:MAG: hypothetical protein DRI34_03170 [Deltaproteobacteria bacterium]|nr:MAG: hypothetical protein DRI34_03170 [Deltaproteobacteria bacterium]
MLLTLLAAGIARAQEPAGPAVDSISELRLRLERLRDAGRELAARRDVLSGQLDEITTRIDLLKSRHPAGRLLPDFELEGLLRRSQQLAVELEASNRGLQALDGQRRRLLSRLATLLRQQLEQLLARARRDTAAGQGRTDGERLLALRRELGQVQKQLNRLGGFPSSMPAVPPARQVLASDDPERLRQQADALQDERDRLRRLLEGLEQRIAEARSQLELDRQMNDFLQDHSLFGEEEHALRVARADAAPQGAGGDEDQRNEGFSNGTGSYDQGGPPGECPGGMCGTPGEGTTSLGGAGETENTSGRLPPLPQGDSAEPDNLAPATLLRHLDRRRREVIRRLKELQVLYDRLTKKLERLQGTAAE